MKTLTQHWELHQGASVDVTLPVLGLPTSGHGVRMHIRDAHDSVLPRLILSHDGAANLRVTATTAGIRIQIGASITGALDMPLERYTWVYSAEVYSLSDVDSVLKPVAGEVYAYKDVTREDDLETLPPIVSADGRYVRHDGAQGLSDAAQARAWANMGGDARAVAAVGDLGGGADGDDGWSPVLVTATNMSTGAVVLKVHDWIGGTGTKPATGQYLSADGLTSDIDFAVGINGPPGAQGDPGPAGTDGIDGEDGADGSVAVGAGTANTLLLVDATGAVIARATGLTYDPTTQALAIAGATVTANSPSIFRQTWNNGSENFYGLGVDITTTACGYSRPFFVKRNGADVMWIDNGNNFTCVANGSFGDIGLAGGGSLYSAGSDFKLGMSDSKDGEISFCPSTLTDAASVKNGTRPTSFRAYGTFTDYGNYARGALSATATAVTLAAETAGTGANDVPVILTPAGTAHTISSAPLQLPSFTVATLPSASTAAALIYVSDETGGAVIAFSDGTNWRRVTDRSIVA